MSQIQITGEAKIRSLNGALTATSGVVDSVPLGGANGVATLGGDGKVPSSQLPSYVDDVVEVANYAALPIPGEVGKIYVTLDTNYIYRWTGSTYVQIIDTSAVWGAITGTLSNQIDLQNALNAKVPYTGATANVNLGEYGITSGFVGFDLTPTATPTTLGTMSWNSFYRTPEVITGTGATTLQIGQEQVILIHNNTGSTLTDGQVVYITGSTGELPSVSLADASSETTSAATLGVITESIANGANGFATVNGMVHGLNTLAFNEGDLLWLSETAGQFTNVKPISPAHLVLIGYVVKKAGGNGSILVKIQNTQELEECSDVLFTSLANNDILAYESSTDLWKNKTIANVLGYTPADDSLVVKLAGTQTITGLKTFGVGLQFPSAGSGNQSSYFVNTSSIHSGSAGSNGFGFNNSNNIYFGKGSSNGGVLAWNNTAIRSYNLPDTSGTIALTSDLGSYLPLSGGTLTGDLTINNGSADGGQLVLASSGYSNWSIDNYSGSLRAYYGASVALSIASNLAATFSSSVNIIGALTMGTINSSLKSPIVWPYSNDAASRSWSLVNDQIAYGDFMISQSTTQTGSFYVQRMYFSPTGNVGIGTSNPTSKLAMAIASSGTNVSGLDITNNVDASFNVSLRTGITEITAGGTGNMVFSNSTERMRITSGGTVAVNTSSPNTDSKFFVKGGTSGGDGYSAIFTNNAGSTTLALRNDQLVIAPGIYSYNYASTANVFVQSDGVLGRNSSSLKYKKNIEDYTKGLDYVLKLRPVLYESRNPNEDSLKFTGFIAEEVSEIGLTELVHYDKNEPDSLHYPHFVALLTKGIQELKAEKDAEILELRNQIEELKELIKNK